MHLDQNVAMCDIDEMMTLNEYTSQAARGHKTQADFAKEFGISRSYLAEILSGAKRPGRDTIEKIEQATCGQVPASVWFSRSSPPEVPA